MINIILLTTLYDLLSSKRIPGIKNVTQDGHVFTLFLEKDVYITSWLKHIPDELDIQELSIDRISLHEIFINIASGKHVMEARDLHA